MNISAPVFVVNSVVRASFTVIVTAACWTACAQTNSWTSPTSGNWEDSSSWSLGVPPGSGQTVLVENHGWKAVAITANTAQNFPQTMTIDALRILSPGTDTVNSVLLNYAGLQTPLTIANDLDVSNNTSMVILQSAVQANSGIWVGGTVTEDASSQVSALGLSVSGGAAYYLTNGTLSVSRTGYESLGGQFVQAGGSNFCGSLDVSGGEYDLSGGQLVVLPPGAPGEDGILVYGNFVQSGGTAGDWLSVGKAGVKGGTYELSGGFLHASFLALPTEPDNGTEPNPDSSEMSQTGGTNVADSMNVGEDYVGDPEQGLGTYLLTNGLLVSSSLTINGLGNFFQYGGIHSNASMTLSQSELMGGPPYTNYFVPGHYFLHGGTFISGLVSGQPGAFFQTAGSCQITTLQISGGQYGLMGGQLTMSDMSLSNGASFTQTGGTVTQTGTLTLAGANLMTGQSTQQFGELLLSGNTNSTLTFSPGASALHFANSSGQAWSSGAMLVISNWNGSLSGGGATQIFFGSDSTGLTSQQLSQVQFINPAGLPSGTYSAQILSDGEVVPNEGAAAGLVNSWIKPGSGNWDDASSWSLGVLPGSSQSVMITNSVWKAVAINPSTPINFPGSMSVSNLTIRGATNTFNTLFLNSVGTGSPLVVGVDSNTPGSLIIGDTNSAVVMISSALTVNNALGANIYTHLGEFDVAGTFDESDGSKVSAGFLKVDFLGAYNFTNSLLTVPSEIIYGHFNQQGGTNLGGIVFTESGEYDLYNGFLEGQVGFVGPYPCSFNQWGGTNISTLGLDGPGVYNLSGGVLISGDITVGPSYLSPSSYGAASVDQTGGTNNAGYISMGVGDYALEGGLLTASNLSLPTVSDRHGYYGSIFTQDGGYFRSGGVNMYGVFDPGIGLQPSTYSLTGGELDTPTISMTFGLVKQTGGTNRAGVITLDTLSSYVLNGGLLIVSNLTQNGQTAFSLVGSIQQSGGSNEVLGTLFVGGNSSYNFTNGLLMADNIQVAGQATFLHVGGSFADLDNIQLAGGSHTVIEGSLRDSTHGAVTGASALFSSSPPVLGQVHVNDKLFAYLQANPKGPGE